MRFLISVGKSFSSQEVCRASVTYFFILLNNINLINATGTAGLGRASVVSLAKHGPDHIYFTGRNSQAATKLIQEVKNECPSVKLTFIKMDMTSLASVLNSCKNFTHDRLDILMYVQHTEHSIVLYIRS